MRTKCPPLSRLIIYGVYIGVILALPAVVYDFYSQGAANHQVAWLVGGVFVLLSLPISVSEVYQHLTHFEQPELQTYIVRILWMVPVYGIESWFSLRYFRLSIYMATLRELYEAYVIYCFVSFLIVYLGGEEELVRKLATKPAKKGKHVIPFCCFRPWQMGRQFLIKAKAGTLQYVVLKCVTSIATFICQSLNVYGDGHFDLRRGYLYCAILNNISQTWALYVLVLFYQATRDDLAPIKPLAKFTVIKAVVFFSWWQGFTISLLVAAGIIHDTRLYSADQLASGLQDFLVCIEMFLAAVAHKFAFPYQDFSSGSDEQTHLMKSFVESSVPLDLLHDVHTTVRGDVRANTADRSANSARSGLTSVDLRDTDEEARLARERAAIHDAFEIDDDA